MQFQEKVWKVPDIACEGCARSIRHALESADGVQQVEVNLLQKTVRVVFDGERVQAEHLMQLIEEAGFTPSE